MLHSLATRDGCLHRVAARFQRASDGGFLPPVGVMYHSFPKRSKDAALLATRDGCLHRVAARFQRASDGGFLPPVGVMYHSFPRRSKDAAFTGNQRWLPSPCGGMLPAASSKILISYETC
jgi:hypothetical protein